MSPLRSQRLGWWLAISLVLLWVLTFGWASFWTGVSLQAAREGDLLACSQSASRALPVVRQFSRFTFALVPDLVVWHEGLWLLTQLDDLTRQVATSIELAPDENQPTLAEVVDEPLVALENLNRELPRTLMAKRLMPETYQQLALETASAGRLVKEKLMTGEQTWVVLFQNSHELRATGGFMGSLAFVTWRDGSITKIDVQDIYQPAGQLHGMIEPPAGVKEYLSGGKGWQLTDANWSPDFPSTATTIISMLEKAGYPPVKGVVAINLDLVISLLEITGPVKLTDYQQPVTSQNVAEVLRSNRAEFFAGSMAKQQLLASFVTQFKHRLLSLSASQQARLLQVLTDQIQAKNVQVFATFPDMQQYLTHKGSAGDQMPLAVEPDFFLELVESNVGINKANQAVDRSVQVEMLPEASSATIVFRNRNQASDRPVLSPEAQGASHLHYVNYQRVYVLPETKVTAITYQNQAITEWDEQLILTSTGQPLKELGFLVLVPEEATTRLELEFTHPTLKTGDTLLIPHQSGVPAYPIIVTWNQQATPLTSDRDLTFRLP